MVTACRRALAGQGAALVVLVGTEVVPLSQVFLLVALQLACAFEAAGFGAGALAALQGLGRTKDHLGQRVARLALSVVLWGLAARHVVLVLDPMMTGTLLVTGSTWALAGAGWLVAGTTGWRRPWSAPESLGRQALWLGLVAVLGGVNTLAMAAVRAAV